MLTAQARISPRRNREDGLSETLALGPCLTLARVRKLQNETHPVEGSKDQMEQYDLASGRLGDWGHGFCHEDTQIGEDFEWWPLWQRVRTGIENRLAFEETL